MSLYDGTALVTAFATIALVFVAGIQLLKMEKGFRRGRGPHLVVTDVNKKTSRNEKGIYRLITNHGPTPATNVLVEYPLWAHVENGERPNLRF
jgi:hypothetical protein